MERTKVQRCSTGVQHGAMLHCYIQVYSVFFLEIHHVFSMVTLIYKYWFTVTCIMIFLWDEYVSLWFFRSWKITSGDWRLIFQPLKFLVFSGCQVFVYWRGSRYYYRSWEHHGNRWKEYLYVLSNGTIMDLICEERGSHHPQLTLQSFWETYEETPVHDSQS